MSRAGVFIGVDKTGNLQKLNDAAAGAKRMHDWAVSQGMVDGTNAKLITDAGGAKVNPDMIYDAIKAIMDGPGVDQLIVYFAGHGVNINRSEHWLLTDAPIRTSAAVNVKGSVDLACYAGIPHIVIISDACRVAPEGIQAQNVRGVDVFPNEGGADQASPVDQYFACLLGRTAAEIKDPAIAAGNFSALYTNALLDALTGARPDLLVDATEPGDPARYLWPEALKTFLKGEIPRRVKALNLEGKVNQNPDALLMLGGGWLSRVEGAREVQRGPRRGRRRIARIRPAPPTLLDVSQELVRSAVAGPAAFQQQIDNTKRVDVRGADALAGMVDQLALPFGPDHMESQCGIKIRGATLEEFYIKRAKKAELLGSAGDLLRIWDLEGPAASVWLRFKGGFGTVVPAVPGFLIAMTFDDGELIDVAYEPSANSGERWEKYSPRARELRSLRAAAASASQHGRFQLEGAESMDLVQRMQYAGGIDPTFALYAAYAYHDHHAIDRILQMSRVLRADLDFTFFDLALLSRSLRNKAVKPTARIVPFAPMLSQGWTLLGAHRVGLHPALNDIERTMRNSLWTLFDGAGLDRLREALQTGDVL